MPLRRSLAFALVLVPALLRAGGPDTCPERHRIVKRVCRDGDPRCDIDRRCDGMCLIGYCIEPFHPRRPCVPSRVSMCRKWSSHLRMDIGDRPQTIEVGRGSPISTIAEFECADRKRSCLAPPQPCTMTLSGGVDAADVPCRIRFSGSRRVSVALVRVEGSLELLGTLTLPGSAPGTYDTQHDVDQRLILYHPDGVDGPYWTMDADGAQIALGEPIRSGRFDVLHGTLDVAFRNRSAPAPAPTQAHVDF